MPRKYVKKRLYKKRRFYKKTIVKNPGSRNAVRYFKLKSVAVDLTSNSFGGFNSIIDNNPTGYQDFASVAQLFDVYRVCAMKIQFFPSFPNNTSTVTNYRPIYLVYDADTESALTNASTAIQYDNFKVKNLYRPWSFYTRIPKIANSALHTSTIFQGGFIDASDTMTVGAILTFAEGLNVSTNYGKILTTLYLKAKMRHYHLNKFMSFL